MGEQIRRAIQNYELNAQVKMLGFLNYAAYIAEMDKADIFLHPSVVAASGDTEGGAPTVILEAQALGIPVVSTRHADIPYVTVPDESALLVPERDAEALAAALVYLIKNPDRWEPMGRAGRKRVETYHDIHTEVHKMEDKYLALIS